MSDTPTKIMDLPELKSLASPEHVIRIPPEANVPLTARVSRILDAAPMQRLSGVSQLGLVSLVYPGATHSRLEHSLGVYRNALLFLSRLSANPRFTNLVDARGAEAFLIAALTHDVAHWPFCHPIEDMQQPGVRRHEQRAEQIIRDSEIATLIERDWSVSPEDVIRLLHAPDRTEQERLLASLLSGPFDVDKMDYLVRDSLHAGVPYGRNFDAARLISAMTVHPERPQLAITDKGRTAAEMLVFSRYVMFSEVYWHHTVRSATAMLQRAVYLLEDRIDLDAMYALGDAAWIDRLMRMASGTAITPLVNGLFGSKRSLYKRVGQFSVLDQPEIHQGLARKPYLWLVECSRILADRLSSVVGLPVSEVDILIDAPPEKLEVDINVDVVEPSGNIRTLEEVSPVAAALAKQQFDNYVKRVRVFVRPDLRASLDEAVVRAQLQESINDLA